MSKNSFRTPYGERHVVTSPSGNVLENEYSVDVDGNPTVTGQTDIYKRIQASRDYSPQELFERYQAGDTSALGSFNDAVFADVSNLPNINDYNEAIFTAQEDFEKMPIELRREFGFNFQKFLDASQETNFLERIAKYLPKEQAQEASSLVDDKQDGGDK